MFRNKVVLFLFRLIVGGVFILSGVLKIREPLDFAQNILNYQVVGRDLAFLTAVALPWIEVLVGALLVSGMFRKSSAFLAAVMLAGFIGLVASVMVRGIDTECGCFGALSGKADMWLLVQDIVLLFFAANIFLERGSKSAK